jgi:hypothetical protein
MYVSPKSSKRKSAIEAKGKLTFWEIASAYLAWPWASFWVLYNFEFCLRS